jgi:hypothetical protein
MGAWRPKGRARERILTYGSPGAGKSYGAGSIARRCLNPGDTMWIIDLDNAWDRLLETEFTDLGVREEWRDGKRNSGYEVEDGCLVVYHCREWSDTKKALERVFARAQFDDWIVLDNVSVMWDDIVTWFTAEMYGTDLPAFLIQARAQLEDEKAEKAGKESLLLKLYQYINPEWQRVIVKPIVTAPCHVYAIAEAKPINTHQENKGVMELYGAFGMKPQSQNRIGHPFTTILLLAKTKMGKRQLTTVKDWGREEHAVRDMEYEDVAKEVLFKVAGWRPSR